MIEKDEIERIFIDAISKMIKDLHQLFISLWINNIQFYYVLLFYEHDNWDEFCVFEFVSFRDVYIWILIIC